MEVEGGREAALGSGRYCRRCRSGGCDKQPAEIAQIKTGGSIVRCNMKVLRYGSCWVVLVGGE